MGNCVPVNCDLYRAAQERGLGATRGRLAGR